MGKQLERQESNTHFEKNPHERLKSLKNSTERKMLVSKCSLVTVLAKMMDNVYVQRDLVQNQRKNQEVGGKAETMEKMLADVFFTIAQLAF